MVKINALQVYLQRRPFLLFYRATARQRGNSFPSCAWRISQLHRDFSLAFALDFLDLTTFYDKSSEKYIRLIFLLHFSSNIIFSDKFCTLFHSFLTVLYTFHTPVQSLFLHTLSFLHHDLKKQCLSDTSCFNSFHCNYISFNLKIRHIEKGILHSVNLNE